MEDEPHRDHVAVRLDAATQARIEAVAEKIRMPWGKATRTEALRAVILAGLDALEAMPPAASGAPAEPPGKS
jgi:predicted Zn-dependent protease